MSYESSILARLEHKVCQLVAAVDEAEIAVGQAIEDQAVVIRAEAAKPASYVSRDNLSDAEVKVNLARYRLDGAKQLVAKEQKHQATARVKEAIERCKRADEQVTDWAETWKQCVRLIERAARSYGRAWAVIKKARQDFERPHHIAQKAFADLGLGSGNNVLAGGNIEANIKAVWDESIRKYEPKPAERELPACFAASRDHNADTRRRRALGIEEP